jgi:hypothetical protein
VALAVVVAGTALAAEHFEASNSHSLMGGEPSPAPPNVTAQAGLVSWCASDTSPRPTSSSGSRLVGPIIDWIPFLQFHGITYLPGAFGVRGTPHDLSQTDLGPLCGTVAFKVQDVVVDPAYRTRDGDSAFLPIGTPVYELRGFSPRFRLAAQSPDGLMLFEAFTDPLATTASDQLGDLDGRVVSIALRDGDDRHLLREINETPDVQHLVALLLAAPVDYTRQAAFGDSGQLLDFTLSDGGHVIRTFFPGDGVVSNRIFVPREFVTAVEPPEP